MAAKEGGKDMPANEIRITNQRSQRVYITYIIRALEGGPDREGKEGQKFEDVVIRGMGRAIYSAVNIAEIIKRRVGGLHQITTISSEAVSDNQKEGAPARRASVICIRLSRKPLDTTDPGYQTPIPAEQVVAQDPERTRGRGRGGMGGRGRGRGGRGGGRGGRGGFEERRGRGGFEERRGRGGREDREERDDRRVTRGGGRGSRGGEGGRGYQGAPRGGYREDRYARGGDRQERGYRDRDDNYGGGYRRGGRDDDAGRGRGRPSRGRPSGGNMRATRGGGMQGPRGGRR